MKVEWVPVAAIFKEDAFSKKKIIFEYRRHYMEKISVKGKRSVWISHRVFMTHKKCKYGTGDLRECIKSCNFCQSVQFTVDCQF